MRKWQKVLLVLAIIVLVIVGGIFFYIKAPDMNSLSYYLPSIDWAEVKDHIPLIKTNYPDPAPMNAEDEKVFVQNQAQVREDRQNQLSKEQNTLAQIKKAGVPASGVYYLSTDKGEPILAITLEAEGMVTDAVAGGAQAITNLAKLKDLDLNGIDFLTTAIRDNEGRTIFAVTVKTTDIIKFRDGQTTREQFLKTTAAQFQSREGALALMRRFASE